MERVASRILPRLYQDYRLKTVDQVSQMRMGMIGIHKPRLGHHESRAAQLDCRLREEMSVDGSVASEHALSADNAGFNCLTRLHDRKQGNHATQRKVDLINRSALLVKYGIRLKLLWDEPRLDAFEFVSRKLPQNAVLYDVL
jgi:hypothetical protein